jgi:hypothetical protein
VGVSPCLFDTRFDGAVSLRVLFCIKQEGGTYFLTAFIAFWQFRYLVYATLPDGSSFTAFTYAGELCCPAFGFNSHGMVSHLFPTKPEVSH